MYITWLKFIACAGLIFFAGKRVAKYADAIAEKTGLGHLWIGTVLVAATTSLPEVFTGVGSVVFVDAPDLTVGNIFGANSYNLLNLGVLDLFHKGGSLLNAVSSGQLLVAVSSLVPLTLAILAITLAGGGFSEWNLCNVGIFSAAIFVSYCLLTKAIYNFETSKGPREAKPETRYSAISLQKAYTYYGLAALLIVGSGVWLAYIGKELSGTMGLDQGFVGSLFIGFATTLPEITVSLAALLIGAREIAVANMVGSNLFNITIIFIDDILYRKAPILQAVSLNQLWPASVVIALTAVVIVAMVTKPRRKFFNISWYVPILLIVFLLGAFINFSMRR